jgi:hypothetical protein
MKVIRVSEETLLVDIERRLIDEFPCVSTVIVDVLIRQEHARFETIPIRDFVPLLVERQARQQLKHRTN